MSFQSIKKGLATLLAGVSLTLLLPWALSSAPFSLSRSPEAAAGMETEPLSSSLPEGYRVTLGEEVRFLPPEELLCTLAGPEWDALSSHDGDANTALSIWCILTHSRLLGEMGDLAEELTPEELQKEPWLTLSAAQPSEDQTVYSVISQYADYFLSNGGSLVRADASLSDILSALQSGLTPAEIFASYGGEEAVLQKAAEK